MLRKPVGSVLRTGAVSILFTALLATPAFAQAPATGLGQAWPNATDVSVSPHYHVYVFVRDGIRYIQVNDLNGTVRGAVAMADRVVLVLPVGADAAYVTTQRTQVPTASAANSETVYNDGTTRITATPASAGTLQLNVFMPSTICTNPLACNSVSVGAGN